MAYQYVTIITQNIPPVCLTPGAKQPSIEYPDVIGRESRASACGGSAAGLPVLQTTTPLTPGSWPGASRFTAPFLAISQAIFRNCDCGLRVG